MSTLQTPVISPMISCAKKNELLLLHNLAANPPLVKPNHFTSKFLGQKRLNSISSRTFVGFGRFSRRFNRTIRCSFSSSSDGNGSTAENSNNVSESDYVVSSVVEAVEVRNGVDGFSIKMRDGRHLRCVHNNPVGLNFSDYSSHPAIVLRMEDGTGLLLPIIVLEAPSVLLMAAISDVHIARPPMYQVVKDMVDKMGYTVKLVRITKRVNEAYFAELHLAKSDNEADCAVFDCRPSDAINIAVRCKVPIQVNKFLAHSDGMRIVDPSKGFLPSDSSVFNDMDRPTGQPCIDTKEFVLVKNMLIAAVEERYADAALWRDKLMQLRSKKNRA